MSKDNIFFVVIPDDEENTFSFMKQVNNVVQEKTYKSGNTKVKERYKYGKNGGGTCVSRVGKQSRLLRRRRGY